MRTAMAAHANEATAPNTNVSAPADTDAAVIATAADESTTQEGEATHAQNTGSAEGVLDLTGGNDGDESAS